MTLLTLDARIGKFALIAAAVAIALIAVGAPAVTEASGGADAGASAGAFAADFLAPFAAFTDWLSAWNLSAPSPI